MEEKIIRKFTKKECLENGGHFWKYYDSHQPVCKKTFETNNVRYAMGGDPIEYRGCPLCGRIEEKIPSIWKNKKEK